MILLVSALTFWYIGDILAEFFRRGQSDELFASLSGRTNWWDLGFYYLQQRPVLGYGAYAGSRFVVLSALGYDLTSSIHNAWLEILLGSGIVGFIPAALAFISVWFVICRLLVSRHTSQSSASLLLEAAGILAMDSVYSMFTVGLVWHPSTTFLLVVAYAEIQRRRLQQAAGA
jgi:O-antigen ligase